MEAIYKLIQTNPDYFAWVFGLVNIMWGVFLYFNKQSHDKKMANLKHSLSLKLEAGKTFVTQMTELENLAGEVTE
ncbi:MAG: hypothetical protein GY760_19965 [Deltaproteobacteria bacterium]|nr:hypothetical protein [Deltaproteobacteria bacterium]